jgi:hypothetical protein
VFREIVGAAAFQSQVEEADHHHRNCNVEDQWALACADDQTGTPAFGSGPGATLLGCLFAGARCLGFCFERRSVENIRLRTIELAGNRFGQALFQSGRKPLPQRYLLLHREGEKLQTGALFLVAPADLAFDIELDFLAGQDEAYAYLCPRSERRWSHHSYSTFTDVYGLAADLFGRAVHDGGRNGKRATKVAPAFAHYQSEVRFEGAAYQRGGKGFSITKIGTCLQVGDRVPTFSYCKGHSSFI